MRTIEAVVVFGNRDEARAATADLIEADCAVEELDLTDDDGADVWLRITVATELKPDGGFSAWTSSIVDPHNGFLDCLRQVPLEGLQKENTMRKLFIAAMLFAAAITSAQAKSLPACDDSDVRTTFNKLRNVVKGWADIKELGGNDTKRMCYAYYFAQTGRTSSAYQETIFSLEWLNEDTGEWWLQLRSSQSIYKGPTQAEQGK
jgi:hypothetical protein